MSDPREFLSIQPMKIENHIGLKITSRSSQPHYTCEVPKRPAVAKQNYIRRKYQLSKCGYHSDPLKPYHELGEVTLDSKKLILTTLGQEEKQPSKEILSSDEDEDPLEFVRETEEKEKAVNISEEKLPTESLHKITDQLNRGVEIIHKVRLGNSLFDVLNDERIQKIDEEEKMKRKKEERGCNEIKMLHLDDSTDSDEDEEKNISKINCIVLDDQKVPQHEDRLFLNQGTAFTQRLSHNSTDSISTTPNRFNGTKEKKKKNLPRPFSPVYNNVNLNCSSSSESLFRQLCVVNWFLEAMAQDSNPPIMQLISNCWKVSDLYADPKLLQRRIDREKSAEPIWQSFKANPQKFQYRASKRSVHHGKISIKHVTSVIHFSNSILSTSKQQEYSDHGGNPNKRISETRRNSKVHQELFKPDLSCDQVSFSNLDQRDGGGKVKSGNVKQSRMLHRRSPSCSKQHPTTEVDGSVNLSDILQDVPKRIKDDFNDVKTEQAIILHDNLEQMEKYRIASYEKKFFAWSVMKNVYETLAHFRLNGKIDKQEDRIETKPKSEWFSDLTRHLHEYSPHDKNIVLILKKLERFCDAEGRKISCSHFLRALSILRPFELCYPDISAGIEFVRDKIVQMDKAQFETWYGKVIRKQHRSMSAPPTSLTAQ